jgi:hypothetical protein
MKTLQDLIMFMILRAALAIMGDQRDPPRQRLAKPGPLPDVARGDAQSWFNGWWCGIAVGAVNGAGLVALLFTSGVLA